MADPNLNVLTAMITPAVLISGVGAVLMSTTVRAGRVSDRLRENAARLRELLEEDSPDPRLAAEEKRMVSQQLAIHSQRSRMILRVMTGLYLAATLFVLSTLFIGASELFRLGTGVLPTLLAIAGAVSLAYSAAMLSVEVRLSARANREEVDFILRLGERYSELYDQTHREHLRPHAHAPHAGRPHDDPFR